MQIGTQPYPFEEYEISDMDEGNVVKYYGYVNKYGKWRIMKNDTSAGSFRYAVGEAEYITNWTNRASLTYFYYYEI